MKQPHVLHTMQLYRFCGLLLAAAMLLLFQACDSGTNTFEDEAISPDGKARVVRFRQQGDMITQNSVHVSVLPVNEPLADTADGNLLICDAGYDRAAFQGDFDLSWHGNDTIWLHYSKAINVISAFNRYGGYTVIHDRYE